MVPLYQDLPLGFTRQLETRALGLWKQCCPWAPGHSSFGGVDRLLLPSSRPGSPQLFPDLETKSLKFSRVWPPISTGEVVCLMLLLEQS